MTDHHDMRALNASMQHGYPVARHRVTIDDACIRCGLCVAACPNGVFRYPDGLNRLPQPDSYRCAATGCENDNRPCVRVCPVDAIQVTDNPSYQVLGDRRWTNDLLTATWYEAEHGRVPDHGEYRRGGSGGGFDALRIKDEDSEFPIPNSETPRADPAAQFFPRWE